tara:strand:- start:1060 stop:1449 length:390 start_codon:yes stop_codon:yes gene_type:complete
MNELKCKKIIDSVYSKIKAHYGISKYQKEFPTIELHYNIYARVTGFPEAEGDCDPDAEYDRHENNIVIYYPKAENKQWILQTLIHEYTHYLQDGEEMQRMYDDEGYEYDTHPFELEAIAAEKDWKLFLK